MARRGTITLDEHTVEQALIAEATLGRAPAFDELARRHAPRSFALAQAITGDEAMAGEALVDATATVFTALRSGRIDADADFALVMATATRNAAVDRTPSLAPADAFASLPEHWRTALWLHLVDELPAGRIAAVLGLDEPATTTLLERAERGLIVAVVAGVDVPHGPTCNRAIARLAARATDSLAADEAEHLDRHLGLCTGCQARRDHVERIPALLAARAVPLPDDIRTRSRAAWAAAVAPEAGSGLSPTTEKILAGVSAFAAAVGVLSFAFLGSPDRSDATADRAAASIAPLLDQIATPRPFDLSSAIAVPVARALPARAAGSAGDTTAAATDEVAAPAPQASAPQPVTALPSPTVPDPAPAVDVPIQDQGEPAPDLPVPTEDLGGVTIGTDVAGIPVAVEVSDDPGLTVGPVSIGSQPEPSSEPVVVDQGAATTPAPVTTVIEPVTDSTVPGL